MPYWYSAGAPLQRIKKNHFEMLDGGILLGRLGLIRGTQLSGGPKPLRGSASVPAEQLTTQQQKTARIFSFDALALASRFGEEGPRSFFVASGGERSLTGERDCASRWVASARSLETIKVVPTNR